MQDFTLGSVFDADLSPFGANVAGVVHVSSIEHFVVIALALAGCARSAPPPQENGYPKAYTVDADPLESALALVHRTLGVAREHRDVIGQACLRDKETKLEALRAEREELPRAELDARARRLRLDVERCVGGG